MEFFRSADARLGLGLGLELRDFREGETEEDLLLCRRRLRGVGERLLRRRYEGEGLRRRRREFERLLLL